LDYFDCAPDSVQQDPFWDRQAAGVFFRDRQQLLISTVPPLTPQCRASTIEAFSLFPAYLNSAPMF
jgi:hypothetical protein